MAVFHNTAPERRSPVAAQAGYSLLEMMIAVAILMVVSASVFSGVKQLTDVGETVQNRSEMHAGVRNATELLQQEVGQAGKISLPAARWLTQVVVGVVDVLQTVTVNSTGGMFVGEKLTIDTGANQETITITAINLLGSAITAEIVNNHAVNTPITVQGGFSSGVAPTNMVNGSTATVLKIFGDINGDDNMVYVEYTCDVANRNLYRNSMPFEAGAKPAPTVAQVLLSNVLPNPGGTPCFTYQQHTVTGRTFVTDVAITLTVQTERPDPVTGQFQTETKALLNVSPRNVFQVWQLATLNTDDRVQPMPASVTALLP
jgi:prepilin-type N-terminal cleavage/methylation domain-containing protein